MLFRSFLDECELLSDHIAIISLGKLKCQGTPSELKSRHGDGYKVHVPRSKDVSRIPYPIAEKTDRYVIRTPDASSAARLVEGFKSSKEDKVYVTGPTIEDVFLKVSDEDHVRDAEKQLQHEDSATSFRTETPSTAAAPELVMAAQTRRPSIHERHHCAGFPRCRSAR